jgi:hypothetical protein
MEKRFMQTLKQSPVASTHNTLLRLIHVGDTSWCKRPQCCPEALKAWIESSCSNTR